MGIKRFHKWEVERNKENIQSALGALILISFSILFILLAF